MSIEAMKQVLEAWQTSVYGSDKHHKAMLLAMTKMNQAIAELESQESQIKTTDPFESAKVEDYNRGWNDCIFASGIVKQSQRTWVGLTDEEIQTIVNKVASEYQTSDTFARAIEVKLKEKNT